MKHRVRLVLGLVLAGFCVVTARLAYVQVWRHGDLSRRAAGQAHRWVREAPRRAPMLDRSGRVLAESVPTASCWADPTVVPNQHRTAVRLGSLLNIPAERVAHRLKKSDGSFVWIKRRLTAEEAQSIESAGLKGVGLQWEYRRAYTDGRLAGSVLGLVGEEGQGLSGLEYAFNQRLIDTRPPRRSLRDGRGRRLSLDPSHEEPAAGGLTLTLDRSLQYIAERELDAGLRRTKARRGLIVVQDPWTGDILALAGRPAADLSGRAPPSAEELKIPAVQWVFEPGSTFKVVTAAAALEESKVRPEDTVECENGRWSVAGSVIRDHDPQRVISFARVMEVSSNIGMAKVGLRLGKETLYDYIRAFGFGSPTGIVLSGEGAGLLRPPPDWSALSAPTLSFGQEVGVTGLQLAAAYSAIANGGLLMEPRLCRLAQWPSGETQEWSAPVVIRRVLTPETAVVLTRLLSGVVERGTGSRAAVPGWSSAGKTGTAQKIDPRTRRYSPDRFIASYCGFVPAENPRFTIVVVLDEPEGVSYGGSTAGPIFKEVAWHALSLWGVAPDAPVTIVRRAKGTPPA